MRVIKKIDVLMPESSQYGVLHHFSRKIFEALERTGRAVRLIESPDFQKIYLQDPPDLSISFNGAPQNPDGIFLCDLIQRPHLSILVDAPYHYYSLLKSPNMAIACVDQFFCELLVSMNFPETFFLPHAVEKEVFEGEEMKRDIDIVMLASFIDYKQRMREWKNTFSPQVVKAMKMTVEQTLVDPNTSFLEIFQNEINQKIKQSPSFNVREIPFFTVFREIELAIKGKGRLDLLKALSPLPVHLFCAHLDVDYWKKALGKTNFTFHPPVDYASSYALMKRSKIVLNSSPHIKKGSQERIIAGMACGAMVVTAENAYLSETFINQEEIVLYRPTELENLAAQLEQHLQKDVLSIAKKGKQKVQQSHTWDHRVKTIFDFYT